MADSFKDMFTRGEIVVTRQKPVNVGEEVEGVVGHVGKDSVLVDLDDKQQAYFDRVDLTDAGGKVLVVPGDRVKGYVVSTEGSIKLARRFGKGEASVDHLSIAMQQGTPVEGKVAAVNKGGVEVQIAGTRGFCDAVPVEKMKAWEAAFLRFMETSYPEIGKDIGGKKIIAEDNEPKLKEAINAFVAGWQG